MDQVIKELSELKELPFNFNYKGSEIIYAD